MEDIRRLPNYTHLHIRLVIGLFGLIGMAGVASSLFMGRFIDRLVPWHASLLSIIMLFLFQSIQVGAAGIHISAVIIAIFGLDVFQQSLQVSLCTAVFRSSNSSLYLNLEI